MEQFDDRHTGELQLAGAWIAKCIGGCSKLWWYGPGRYGGRGDPANLAGVDSVDREDAVDEGTSIPV